MSEYIDKKAVLDMVNSLQYKDVLYPDAAVYNHAIDEVRNLIAVFPTAEVAEVVRCKDCRYVFKEDEYSYWCNGFTSPMRLVTPYTFCSHGRRKND